MMRTRAFPFRRLFLSMIIPFLVVSMALPSCTRRQEDEESEAPAPVVPVKVSQVIRGDAALVVTATGRTDAQHKEKIFSPVAGRITELHAFEGTHFHKNEVMAVLRTKESQAAISGAERLLQAAKTPAQQAEARRALDLAQSTQSQVELRARFDGIIASRAVTEGELVTENTELFTLVDPSSLVFLADVPLSALASVRKGQQAEIRSTALEGTILRGVVDALNPQTDLQSQSVRVRIRFTGIPPSTRALLKADMTGTTRIVTSLHRNALLIPLKALIRNDENDTYSAVVVMPDSIARIVPVSVGIMTDSLAEITGGTLRAGMAVVSEGNYALPDSTRVTVTDRTEP